MTNHEDVGYQFEFDYDKGAREYYAYIKFPSGKVKEVWYDFSGDTKRVAINGTTVQSIKRGNRSQWLTDARGLVTRQDLDEWDNIVRTVYPDESWEERTYQQPGNLLVQLNRSGIITTYEYNSDGDRTAINEAVGTAVARRTEFSYNAEGSLTSRTIRGATPADDAVTLYSYAPSGHLTKTTDPEGRTTTFSDFHGSGNPQEIVDGRGLRTYLSYDAAGNTRVIRDHNTSVIGEYGYDAAGNRSLRVNGAGAAYQYDFDAEKNLQALTDPLGGQRSWTYDPANKPTTVIDAEGHAVSYEYDLFERLVKTIDGAGTSITYEYLEATGCSSCAGGSELLGRIIYPGFIRTLSYDGRDRLLSSTDRFGQTERQTSYTYDAQGNQLSVTDPEGRTTSYSYDALGRLIRARDASDQVSHYAYDTRDNLIQLTDPNGGLTRFSYDRSDRLLEETRPQGETSRYSYDAAGNLASRIENDGARVVYSYDYRNRLTAHTLYAAGTDSPARTITYSYNSADSLSGYDDGLSAAVYGYDALQQRTSETITYPGFSLNQSYTYDKNGQWQSYTDPAGRTRTWQYDAAYRPLGLDLGPAGQVGIGGYDWQRPTVLSLPGGASLHYQYNGVQEVTVLQGREPGGNPIQDYAYNYRPSGKVSVKSTEHGSYHYDYDPLYRLTVAEQPSTTEHYQYDAGGNRLVSGQWDDWQYNANNQLIGYGATSLSYDERGNLISRVAGGLTTSYHYTPDNRLSRVAVGDTEVGSYYYDPFGRRLWKDVAGVRTCFLYSPEGLVGEYDADGKELKLYGYQPSSPWSSNPLFMVVDNTYYWYINDHLGTPQRLIAENGTTVWSARYESFGRATINTEEVVNNLRFPGQYYDSETGLHYNWHRFYDPETGRYISADPIGLAGGINLYVYVEGDPVNFIDPTGFGKTGAQVGAAIGGAVGYVAAAFEIAGTSGLGTPLAPAIVAGSAAIGAGVGHYAEEGIKGIRDWFSEPSQMAGDYTDDFPQTSSTENEQCEPDKKCEEQLARDNATCDAISRAEKRGNRPQGAAARCYSSAMQRYGNCLSGRSIGPLDTWNN